ncbi:LuxR C-terminal-related transcriptional regulator [Kutzneria sp. NPDC051319]|uniref:LuxR C-terminal-related transcriptional regulator n=1 Tax=Kutzneria sp. NPDC051319 TaxID=3155047 RepID=UPI00341709FD
MHTNPFGAAGEVLDRLPAADVRAAVDRLMAVCAGDPVLLCALAFTAAGLDTDTRDRLLRDVARDRPTGPPDGAGPVLTDRQREVLGLLGAGLTARAIAHRLDLSPRTVGKHLERVYRRLGTSDRLTAVIRARHCGLLPDAPARHAVRRSEGDDRDAER